MMQGLILDSSAPLYGRAAEIIKVRPLEPGWIKEALSLNSIEAVEAYSVWGGVPRYWELAKIYRNQEEACKEIVLDRDGVLHNEPMRLLLDDMRGASQPHSLLSLIANGSNRLSEIAGRLGKPATSLTRPLANLTGHRKRPFTDLKTHFYYSGTGLFCPIIHSLSKILLMRFILNPKINLRPRPLKYGRKWRENPQPILRLQIFAGNRRSAGGGMVVMERIWRLIS